MDIRIKRDGILNVLPFLIFVNLLLILGYYVYSPSVSFKFTTEQFIYVLPALLVLTFAAIVALFVAEFNPIKKRFFGIGKKTWVLLLIVVLTGFYLRAFVVTHTHRIFFDEDIYLAIGNSVAREGKAVLCNYGTPDECFEGILNKEPNGYAVILGIVYFLLGTSEDVIFKLSIIVGTLSIALVFLIAYLMFKNERVALYSALLFSLMPSNIIWSGSVGVEIYSLFVTLLAILLFLVYFEEKTVRLQLLASLLLVYAIQMRPENGLYIGVIVAMFWAYERNLSRKIGTINFIAPWLILFLLITPHMMHLVYEWRTDTWGADQGKLGLGYLNYNLPVNTNFFFDNEMHPALFSLFGLVGIIALLKSRKMSILFLVGLLVFFASYYFMFEKPMKEGRGLDESRGVICTALWFLPFLAIFLYSAYRRDSLSVLLAWFLLLHFLYLVFYSGAFTSGGIGTRFAQLVSTPLLIIGGYGLHFIESLFSNRKMASMLLVFLALMPLYPLLPFIQKPDEQAQYAREMHDWAVSKIPEMDKSCYILTHNPNIFLINGRSALQTWNGQNRNRMAELFEKTDCVMFLEGAWCLWEPHKSTVCKNMHDAYNLTVMWRMTREKDPNQTFTIYGVRNPFN